MTSDFFHFPDQRASEQNHTRSEIVSSSTRYSVKVELCKGLL